MRSGAATEQIILQAPVRSRGASGEEIPVWASLWTKFAERRGIGIEERTAASRLLEGERVLWVTRYVPGITSTWRLLYREKAYPLEAVVDKDLRHRELWLYARADIAVYPRFTYLAFASEQVWNLAYRISWTTDGYASGKVRYRETGTGSWTETTLVTSRSLNHAAIISGLVAGKTYDVQLWGANADGWSPGWSATAKLEVPSTALVISGLSFAATSNSIRANFTTSASAKCIIWGLAEPCDDDEPSIEWYDNETLHGTAHSHVKTGLRPGIVYRIHLAVAQATGPFVYSPSLSGRYRVQTEAEEGGGGGYKSEIRIPFIA